MAETTEPKPTEEDVNSKAEEAKNLDRDGGDRQPTDVSDSK